MKEYTIDFAADYIEAKNDKDAYQIALEYVDENYNLWKDDIADVVEADDNDAEYPLKTYMIDFASYSVEATSQAAAMKKAKRYAKSHDLDIVDIDDGYEF